MSDTDSFIEEVTEEVRRDKLYGYLRRYGWIAILAVLLIVGGAAWNEYRKAQAETKAQALGDEIVGALTQPNAAARAAAISSVEADNPEAAALVDMIAASELAATGDTTDAAARLEAISVNPDVPEVYRQIAAFKALLVGAADQLPAERFEGFSRIATPGHPMRVLAEEQLALIEIETGQREAAIARLQAILNDAEAGTDLQQRALQVIVALGGEPDVSVLPQTDSN
ncbi:tetratricopeptide repeat protein [Aliishimia ponticola]|uniref:Tetratricopeptide repeat protein n=1 Tax=Aliishimia ponticola TaxID=2499833 RepID=A0A4S4NFA2_9RHOB|nr:tetratricopeptide repeat protein [Aliishimia ponticola]THH38252.1 tetratricopeptide repeat protein [Aliishimia ponticola]